MYSTPIAYFLTYTVRGSWRHGDVRGSWYRNAVFINPTDPVCDSPNRKAPHTFPPTERLIIENAAREVCAERHWELHAINARSNHVHIVLTAPDIKPESVMKLLKSKATMRLRQHGSVATDEKIWTRHGSTIYLFDEQEFQAACEYVNNQ